MMLKHSLVPALALAVALPAAALAQTGQQQPPPQQPQQERQDERAQQRDTQAQDHVLRADRLIGQAVRDRQDERLGRINDLALRIDDGRIAYAVVNRGGVWGIGGEEVAVPFDQIRPDPQARAVIIDAAQLQQAQRIDTRQTWPTRIGEATTGTAGAAPQHNVLPMSNVTGMDVHNKQGERLGQIDDVVIQRDGSLSYAVIAHGGFLGIGDNYVAVPWDRLNFDAQRQALVLDVTRQQLGTARAFERGDRWPNRVEWPFTGTH
jgi:sporulation protein YlmC with PRC-barrel domain